MRSGILLPVKSATATEYAPLLPASGCAGAIASVKLVPKVNEPLAGHVLHHQEVVAGGQVHGDAVVEVLGRGGLALDQELALAVEQGEPGVEPRGLDLGHEQAVGVDTDLVTGRLRHSPVADSRG